MYTNPLSSPVTLTHALLRKAWGTRHGAPGGTGAWNYGEIYAGGRHLATYSGSVTNFIHSDWLGTKRALTGVNGVVSESCIGQPFGDARSCTGTNWSYTDLPTTFMTLKAGCPMLSRSESVGSRDWFHLDDMNFS